MSSNVVNDHLWSDEEVAYQEARNRYREVALNKKLYGPGGSLEGQTASTVLELDQDIYDHVVDLSFAQLQEALSTLGIGATGDEGALRTKLATALQKRRDDSNG